MRNLYNEDGSGGNEKPQTFSGFDLSHFKEIEIPWNDFLNDRHEDWTDDRDETANENPIKMWQPFMDGWNAFRLGGEEFNFESLIAPLGTEERPELADGEEYPDYLWEKQKEVFLDESSTASGVVIYDYPLKKMYLLLDKSNTPINNIPSNTDSVRDYLFNVVSLVEVYESSEAFESNRSSVIYIDRELQVIIEEFQTIDSYRTFGEKAKNSAIKKLDEISSRWWGDPLALETDFQTYVKLSTFEKKAELLESKLAQKARSLGYVLALEDGNIKLPNGDSNEITRGKLYQIEKREIFWTIQYNKPMTRVRRGRSGKRKVTHWTKKIVENKSAKVDIWEEVNTQQDPVEVEIERLRLLGKNVYRVTKGQTGYYAENGLSVRSILALCEAQKEIRNKTVFVVPDYGPFQELSSQELGANFFHNPMPGKYPIRFPRIFCHNKVAYGFSWLDWRSGMLLESINLAPGEEKSIATSSSVSEEISVSSSLQIAIGNESEQTDDISTLMEKEVIKEHKKSTTKSASASVSGSYGPVGGSASASTSSTSSLRNFARGLNKSSKRAVRKVNTKRTRNSTQSYTSKNTYSSEYSSSTTIRNINTGHTLNLLIHQIDNVFSETVKLEGVSLYAEDSRELIAGSNLFEAFDYPLEDFDQMLEIFEDENLPTPVTSVKPTDGETEEHLKQKIKAKRIRYWKVLIRTILNQIGKDYGTEYTESELNQKTGKTERDYLLGIDNRSTVDDNIEIDESFKSLFGEKRSDVVDRFGLMGIDSVEERLDVSSESGFRISTNATKNLMLLGDIVQKTKASELGELVEKAKSFLSDLTTSDKPIIRNQFTVATKGVLMDAQVGKSSAVEPYAEKMRKLEEEKISAEVEFIRKKTAYLFGDSPANENFITGFEFKERSGKDWLNIRFKEELVPKDGFDIIYMGSSSNLSAGKRFEDADGKGLIFEWSGERVEDSDLENYMAVINRHTGKRMFYLDEE